ncbi:hypothetical protein EV207_13138 [Scopulibacillus darangshiensis]|uniref:Pyridoxamine 5'-phosphate oxidase N-terminal domain-containing protein n=1 Tax=Scopulibacillus darangshiensis TaxID=442528 RepID=A0A4V2SLH2_9BACL|nr:hypothetical protein EV207_13138 [Scopulibacillus darangshiensis]
MNYNSGERYLQKKYGTEKQALAFYQNQMLSYLNSLMIDFIAEQDMVFISTANKTGECDASFKSGTKGFVRVLDQTTLAYPEYRGNGVMASLGNIYENPHIGLMFVDFFQHQVGLHVNGTADIIENDRFFQDILQDQTLKNTIYNSEGTKAERWVLISLNEAYIHCSKHIPVLKRTKHNGLTETGKQKTTGDFFQTRKNKS